jgi:hypothetical protein
VRLLSDLVGSRVVGAGGEAIGELRDLSVRLTTSRPAVTGVVVRRSRHETQLVAWGSSAWTDAGVRLSVRPAEAWLRASDLTLAPDEILLGRDLLDSQIIDLDQHRAARVGDVLLANAPDGTFEVVAVEIGVRAIARRLGLRALARRMPEEVVDVEDLHMTSSRGHAVQLRAKAAPLHHLDDRGLADLLSRLDPERATAVLDAVEPARAAAAVGAVHPVVRNRLLPALGRDRLRRLTRHLDQSHARAYDEIASRHGRRPRLSRHRGWRRHPPPPRRDTGRLG